MGSWPIWISLGVLLLAGASFFCALAETAFFTLSKWQVRQLGEQGGRRGQCALAVWNAAPDALATLVLGNMLANAGLVLAGVWLVMEREQPALGTLGGLFLLILLGGEVLPKTLAVRAPEFWAVRAAGTVQGLMRLTRPVRALAQRLNERILRALVPSRKTAGPSDNDEDYTELLDLAYQEGALGESGRDIILQIITLDRRMARDVMLPRARMDAIAHDTPPAEVIRLARQMRHSRIPLYEDTPDNVVGILNTTKLLLDPPEDLDEVLELPSFVPETMDLLDLLRSLQRQHRGLAVVLDEYGSTAGVVSVEDILSPLLGPKDRARLPRGSHRQIAPGVWRVSGIMRADDFRRLCPDLGRLPEVETLGGMVTTLAGVVPPAGHEVTLGNVRLKAIDVDERRVKEVEVRVVGRKEASRA